MLQTQEDKGGSELAECFHTLRISQMGQDGAVLGTVSDFVAGGPMLCSRAACPHGQGSTSGSSPKSSLTG